MAASAHLMAEVDQSTKKILLLMLDMVARKVHSQSPWGARLFPGLISTFASDSNEAIRLITRQWKTIVSLERHRAVSTNAFSDTAAIRNQQVVRAMSLLVEQELKKFLSTGEKMGPMVRAENIAPMARDTAILWYRKSGANTKCVEDMFMILHRYCSSNSGAALCGFTRQMYSYISAACGRPNVIIDSNAHLVDDELNLAGNKEAESMELKFDPKTIIHEYEKDITPDFDPDQKQDGKTLFKIEPGKRFPRRGTIVPFGEESWWENSLYQQLRSCFYALEPQAFESPEPTLSDWMTETNKRAENNRSIDGTYDYSFTIPGAKCQHFIAGNPLKHYPLVAGGLVNIEKLTNASEPGKAYNGVSDDNLFVAQTALWAWEMSVEAMEKSGNRDPFEMEENGEDTSSTVEEYEQRLKAIFDQITTIGGGGKLAPGAILELPRKVIIEEDGGVKNRKPSFWLIFHSNKYGAYGMKLEIVSEPVEPLKPVEAEGVTETRTLLLVAPGWDTFMPINADFTELMCHPTPLCRPTPDGLMFEVVNQERPLVAHLVMQGLTKDILSRIYSAQRNGHVHARGYTTLTLAQSVYKFNSTDSAKMEAYYKRRAQIGEKVTEKIEKLEGQDGETFVGFEEWYNYDWIEEATRDWDPLNGGSLKKKSWRRSKRQRSRRKGGRVGDILFG